MGQQFSGEFEQKSHVIPGQVFEDRQEFEIFLGWLFDVQFRAAGAEDLAGVHIERLGDAKARLNRGHPAALFDLADVADANPRFLRQIELA